MELTARHRLVVAWLLLGSLAAAVCALIWPAAHMGTEVIPVGNDSFYHARRILDAAANPSGFYEFDAKIHAPEGSLLVWPWGYDYAMAWLVRIGTSLGLAQQPIQILVWLPVAAVFISIGLILSIGRRMGLSLAFCSLAAVCVALSPLTQYLHGVGFVDHHFAEYILVLATVLLGLRWFEDKQPRTAMALGLVLGVAPAIHNALFILQIPVLLCLFIRWLLQQKMPWRSTMYFCASLLVATVAVLAPSLPFQQGRFDFYYLSWFHLYIACGTALCSIFFTSCERQIRTAVVLIAGGTVLLIPLAYQIGLAESFLTGKLTHLDAIAEMASPLEMLRKTSFTNMSNRYSLLLWLSPLTYLYCACKAWQERRSPRLFYWVSAVLGLSLLSMQFRMHYFGTFALCIPLLVAIQEFSATRPKLQKYSVMVATCLVLAMYAPPMRNQLLGPMITADDASFMNLRKSMQVLAEACRRDPGVVLADNDVGHYIRYYTECSVIADNFLLTRQHEEKIHEMERLFIMSANEMPAAAPFVKYVFVRPAAVSLTNKGVVYMSYIGGRSQLVADLLLQPHATPPVPAPASFELLYETNMVDTHNIEVPYLALYKIHRDISIARHGRTEKFGSF